ncbi:DUF4376 domain-containing protein [Variovorax sp. NFACC27]|uniref:DUF4376 domain-containing protein n=1 Tax=unclassified Variovorax TaxID=663243 RepID=UPI0008986BFE|nr:protein of unknown function [Variovorax sp. NFACC28]SEF98772.1 protein of unknown function [Variovorax sp. NFACC29]SFB94122.1 protein of unknown function [Variovorax sp. NFACC26]SFF81449.1 protein of unknown function [Variovorax sp. NFACC27]
MKTVYAFHPETKAYCGLKQLDRTDISPLEQDRYLVPGDCLESAPPKPLNGMWPVAVSGAWVLMDLPAEPKLELTPDELRSELKVAVTMQRWSVETGGITLADGVKVKTGIDDRARIAQAIQGMEANGYTDVSLKIESGWVTFTLPQMNVLMSSIASHVRACFEAERAHHLAIDALDASAINGYDVRANWPSGHA